MNRCPKWSDNVGSILIASARLVNGPMQIMVHPKKIHLNKNSLAKPNFTRISMYEINNSLSRILSRYGRLKVHLIRSWVRLWAIA